MKPLVLIKPDVAEGYGQSRLQSGSQILTGKTHCQPAGAPAFENRDSKSDRLMF